MFSRRPDHFEEREKRDIQLILKKEKNRSFVRTEYELNVVLRFEQNIE